MESKPAKEKCPICGKILGKYYVKTHLEKQHGIVKKAKPKQAKKPRKKSKKVKTPIKIPIRIGPCASNSIPGDITENDLDEELDRLFSGLEIEHKIGPCHDVRHPVNPTQATNSEPVRARIQNVRPIEIVNIKSVIKHDQRFEVHRGKVVKKVLEQDVQKKLEKKYKCKHKKTPAGIIDLFMPDRREIWEIKHWKSWKHAIGQLMAYSFYFPSYMLRAHFFGPIPSEEKRIVVITVCTHYRIDVSWEK